MSTSNITIHLPFEEDKFRRESVERAKAYLYRNRARRMRARQGRMLAALGIMAIVLWGAMLWGAVSLINYLLS